MRVQELIDKLQKIKEEHGNLEVVTPDSRGRLTDVGIWGGEKICVNNGIYEYNAIKVDVLD